MLLSAFVLQLFMTQSQSSVIKYSSFIFLQHEVSNNKPGMDEGYKHINNLVAFLQ